MVNNFFVSNCFLLFILNKSDSTFGETIFHHQLFAMFTSIKNLEQDEKKCPIIKYKSSLWLLNTT